MIRRIVCIILWSLGFYFLFSLAGGMIFGILIGFTDFDIEAGVGRLVGMVETLGLIGLLLGLILGIREVLPGTKRPRLEPAGAGNPGKRPETARDL